MGAEAYRPRKRYIYALFFNNGCCYIGQSINPTKRADQHSRPSGGWNMHFQMIVLHSFRGTRTDGEHYEYAYRLKALRNGWTIYGLPHVIINPKKRATIYQWGESFTIPWPKEWRRKPLLWPWIAGVLALIALYQLPTLFL